jgi:stalled ribosome rescue protein Dom34
MHQKEQHEQSDYYKKIGEAIKNYQEVLLFGPTNAKTELLNLL